VVLPREERTHANLFHTKKRTCLQTRQVANPRTLTTKNKNKTYPKKENNKRKEQNTTEEDKLLQAESIDNPISSPLQGEKTKKPEIPCDTIKGQQGHEPNSKLTPTIQEDPCSSSDLASSQRNHPQAP